MGAIKYFRPAGSQVGEEGVSLYEAAAETGQTGVDRQEHPLPGGRG